ncbi:MAG: hypothetical protein JOZ45_07490 [Acidobacteriaceae bacterium]|nr:hypothetical protein [Acidobacteriaceae bacterium]
MPEPGAGEVEPADTQDFVRDTGKEFVNSGAKAFLQAFKSNAKIAPRLSDAVKGAVSDISRVTNVALNMEPRTPFSKTFRPRPPIQWRRTGP